MKDRETFLVFQPTKEERKKKRENKTHIFSRLEIYWGEISADVVKIPFSHTSVSFRVFRLLLCYSNLNLENQSEKQVQEGKTHIPVPISF